MGLTPDPTHLLRSAIKAPHRANGTGDYPVEGPRVRRAREDFWNDAKNSEMSPSLTARRVLAEPGRRPIRCVWELNRLKAGRVQWEVLIGFDVIGPRPRG